MCQRDTDATARTFYDRNGWFAVLHVPPHARGHAVLARATDVDGRCPNALDARDLRGLDTALADTVALLTTHYTGIANVLVASLRVRDPHLHLHLIPRWPDDEAAWRQVSGHREGRLFSFLGDLERLSSDRAVDEQRQRRWSDEQLRQHYIDACRADVAALRRLAAASASSGQNDGADPGASAG